LYVFLVFSHAILFAVAPDKVCISYWKLQTACSGVRTGLCCGWQPLASSMLASLLQDAQRSRGSAQLEKSSMKNIISGLYISYDMFHYCRDGKLCGLRSCSYYKSPDRGSASFRILYCSGFKAIRVFVTDCYAAIKHKTKFILSMPLQALLKPRANSEDRLPVNRLNLTT
jgi:hypothetical protein